MHKKVIKTFKHIFIPHEHNDYKPHCFRELSVGIIAVVLIVLFSISASTKLYIDKTDMVGAVLPAVLVDLTNNARESNGITLLARNSVLDEAAQLKANDMATNGYFAHTSPEGLTPWHWFSKVNYIFSYAGENLAIDFSESVDVEKAWLASPGHKANILNNKFTEIGIATAEGYYNGHPTTYVVQMFGKPIFSSISVVLNTEIKDEINDISILKNTDPINTIDISIPKDIAPVETNDIIDKISVLPGVKGEDINVFPEISNLEIIKEDGKFISVKNNSVSDEESESALSIKEKYSRWHERFLFLAPFYANTIYKIIIFIVLLALILMTIIEIKRQHPKNIMYGILLLIIISCLIYINKAIFLMDFLI